MNPKRTMNAPEPCITGIAETLRQQIKRNPHCRHGVLARNRVAVTEKGYLSHRNDKELFCRLGIPGIKHGHWYGHVLRVAHKDGITPLWAAVLVNAKTIIDGDTIDDLFRRIRYKLNIRGQYQGAVIVQKPDEAFALCDSFEQAAAALAHMIERFDPTLRSRPDDCDNPDLDPEPEPEGRYDPRSLDIYGFPCDHQNYDGVSLPYEAYAALQALKEQEQSLMKRYQPWTARIIKKLAQNQDDKITLETIDEHWIEQQLLFWNPKTKAFFKLVYGTSSSCGCK